MSQTQGSGAPLLEYDGKISELFGIFLLNLLLTVLTFGIFRFWAITRIRRYIWSHLRFQGTRLTYTGKGKELFVGFLLAILILGLVGAAAALIATALAMIYAPLAILAGIVVYIAMFILFGAAHFSAQRYRLSRTEWRGIRGGMEGSALRYGLAWMLYLLSTIFTLYQSVPWMQVGLARRRINASRFGSAELRFGGRAGSLYLSWLATIVGYIVLLGGIAAIVIGVEWSTLAPVFTSEVEGPAAEARIQRAIPVILIGVFAFSVLAGLLATWYFARLTRLLMGNTSIVIPGALGAARFNSTVSAGPLLWLFVGNALIALFTLGLGLPIVLHRSIRYLVSTTRVIGQIDANALIQSTQAKPGFGEGMLQALDPGVI